MAFQGIEAVPVDVQVQIVPGLPRFIIVGLPDKAVAESGERVRSALHASGLSLPAKRIIVNLAPADLPKEGSHYDLPIALALMAAIGAVARRPAWRFRRPGRIVAGWHHRGRSRRPAGGDRRQCEGGRADLPGRFRSGSRLGERRHGDPRPAQPDRHRQSFPRHPGPVATGGRHCRRPAMLCPTLPNHGPGDRQRALEVAAAGGHNLLMVGPPVPASRCWQPPALHPAAALAVGTARHSVAKEAGPELWGTRNDRDSTNGNSASISFPWAGGSGHKGKFETAEVLSSLGQAAWNRTSVFRLAGRVIAVVTANCIAAIYHFGALLNAGGWAGMGLSYGR